MRYDAEIHDGRHLLKHVLGTFEGLRPASADDEQLLVLNYHSTPRKFLDNFCSQVAYFREHFAFLEPHRLADFYARSLPPVDRTRLLITFDDGIANNAYAAEVLEREGARALFFVIPDFIDTDRAEQPRYYRSHIRPNINTKIDSETSDVSALTWKDLKSLRAAGHAIGSHTCSHTLVAGASPDESRREIEDSRLRIAAGLDVPIETIHAYCTPNDSLTSTGELELQLISDNYRFLFSTYPGVNSPDSNPYFIRRSNVECFWLPGAVKYSIGRLDRWRWRRQVSTFSRMASAPAASSPGS